MQIKHPYPVTMTLEKNGEYIRAERRIVEEHIPREANTGDTRQIKR